MADPQEISLEFNGNLPVTVNRRSQDDLPAHIKGTAKWHSQGITGPEYYIPQHQSPRNALEPIKFINNQWFGLSFQQRHHLMQPSLAININNIFDLEYQNENDPQHTNNQAARDNVDNNPPILNAPVALKTLLISAITINTTTADLPNIHHHATMSVNMLSDMEWVIIHLKNHVVCFFVSWNPKTLSTLYTVHH